MASVDAGTAGAPGTTGAEPGVPRAARVARSGAKIAPPFALDPTLCFYSPQENVEAFAHPRVAAYLRWLREEWAPPAARPRLALLLPCTKAKPYPVSAEHRAVNGALLGAGWAPEGGGAPPAALLGVLGAGEDPRLLDTSPLVRGGVALDRIVVSEPLALVPYEAVYAWAGGPSPATAYDDPGLFEARGTSVSPWRGDCTARPVGPGRWRWGPAEREAYVEAHNTLSAVIAEVLGRVAGRYAAIVAWVSPGLTHRSFLVDARQRREEGLPCTRRGRSGVLPLIGVADRVAGAAPGLVTVLPTGAQLAEARAALAARLERDGRPASHAAVRGVYTRGDGTGSPLGLPETLRALVAHLDRLAETAS